MQAAMGSCNVLPGVVVEAYMIVVFKRVLDGHIDMLGMVIRLCDRSRSNSLCHQYHSFTEPVYSSPEVC